MTTPHRFQFERSRIGGDDLLELDLKGARVRFGPRQVGDSSFRVLLYPGVIVQTPI